MSAGTLADSVRAALNRVTVVTVTHHSAHCVPGMAHTLAPFPHVVAVDNASHDGTPELLRQALPHAQVMELPANLGFGAANNRALNAARTPYALLLNPDCHISPQAVAQLVATADALPTAVIVAPQLLDERTQPQLNYGWLRWHWPSKGPQAEGLVSVGHACAAAWLLRLDEQAWRFDEAFFLYYEDEDLCARIWQQQGDVVIDPQAQAMHANRGSVRGRSVAAAEWRRGFHHSRSKLLFTHRHVGAHAAQRLRRKTLWLGAAECLLRLLTLQPRLVARSWGRWMGMWRPWQPPQPAPTQQKF